MCPKNDAPGVKNTRSYNALSESPPPVYLPQSCIAILVAIYWHTQLQRRFLAHNIACVFWTLFDYMWCLPFFEMSIFLELLMKDCRINYKSSIKSEEFLDGKGFIMISRSQDVKKCSIIPQSSKHLNLPLHLCRPWVRNLMHQNIFPPISICWILV